MLFGSRARGGFSLLSPLLVMSAFLRDVYADVEFLTPVSGESYSADDTFQITWQESGDVPALSTVTTTSIILCTGSNDDIVQLSTLVDGESLSSLDGGLNVTLNAAVAADGTYFIKMQSIISTGYVINYSDRFTLTGMTGSQEASDGGSTTAPSRVYYTDGTTVVGTTTFNTVTTTSSYVSQSVITNSFDVPYQYQGTWTLKYAPMQTQPGTTITATKTARLYPTSSVTIFTTNTLPPQAYSTTTTAWDYVMTTVVNDASAQPNPSIAGHHARFVRKRRWDD
ncbi:uncharacterized protein V1518DRAFT_414852 [Limtongia smithiae]|uniref:uncharacterized protein n=1 Tax=Limtongia smithiae TaxID=1125753 RepID=UPI0034CFF3F2